MFWKLKLPSFLFPSARKVLQLTQIQMISMSDPIGIVEPVLKPVALFFMAFGILLQSAQRRNQVAARVRVRL